MKTRIHKTLQDGRVLGDSLAPLHLRIDLEDGRLAKVAFGIETDTRINWQLLVTPASLSWAAGCVEAALLRAPDEPAGGPGAKENFLDHGTGGA